MWEHIYQWMLFWGDCILTGWHFGDYFLAFFDPSGGGVFSNADIASSNFTPLKSSS
jgi:hypothetical protein